MNNVRVFHVLVILTFTIYVAWFCFPYLPSYLSEYEQDLVAHGGYGADLPIDDVLFYGTFFGLVLIATLGLYFFQNWARHLFLALSLLDLAITPFSGFIVQPPIDGLFFMINLLLDGAILAMAYLSPLSASFKRN